MNWMTITAVNSCLHRFLHLYLFSLSHFYSRLSVEGGMLPDGPLAGPAFGPFPQEEIEPRLLELEQDPPNWRELADGDNLSKLSKMETKRQEVINGKERKNKY